MSRNHRLNLLPSLALALIGVSCGTSSDVNASERVSVELLSLPADEKRCFELAFTSTVDRPLYLTRWDTVQTGVLEQDLFEVRSERGDPYPYKGRLIKRAELTQRDLVLVPALGRIGSRVCIEDYYGITEDAVAVRYEATVPLYVLSGSTIVLESLERLVSNELHLR